MRKPVRLALVTVLAALLFAPLAAAEGAPRYEVAYRAVAREHTFDGVLKEGETRTLDLYVAQPNVTSVDAILRWTETGDRLSVSRPDTFTLSASTPKGDAFPGSPARSANGLVLLGVGDLATIPTGGPTNDASSIPPPDLNGKGVYRVAITLANTGNPEGTRVDNENAYILSIIVHTYEASVVRVVSLPDAVSMPAQGLRGEDKWTWTTLALGGASAVLGVVVLRGKKKA